ncbi:MAG TPA: hypothetical protein DIC18_03155 [Clostridiales bacterium]|nr:hypothetical protein [Clostridiales bacterium]
MDKIGTSKKNAARYVFTVLTLLALSAIIVGVVVAFRSVYSIKYDILTLLSSGFLIFVLLFITFIVLGSFGKGDGVSCVFVYSVLLITIVASVVCLHFGYAFAMPLCFLPLLLGMDFDKKSALTVHLTSLLLTAVCITLFTHNGEEMLDLHDLYLRMMILVVDGAMGIFLIFLIRPFANRLRVLFISTAIVIGGGIVGFISPAAVAGTPDIMEMITVGVSVVIGGGASIFAYFCLTPIFERVFNLNTGLRLMELCSFNQPLLKELEEKAPGTFNHSLTVANIAERAAYAIGEDSNLAKAAALFHDIGKMENPEFFTENQTDGYNPHDELIPEVSVKMITRHTEVGSRILTAKGFPKEIISATLEHHGDSPVGYFYNKAQKITEGTLEEKGYTYAGPKPQTKINAIIMIADISEAATRSVRPSTHEELATLVDKLVRQKMIERQFDECPITMSELTKVKQAVVSTLMGVHHERISYSIDKKNK